MDEFTRPLDMYSNMDPVPRTWNLRTPLELALKVLTVHLVVTANYAHLCHLQKRNRNGFLYIVRILLFIFVPMLCLAELLMDFLMSLLKFVQNQSDHDGVNLNFYAAGVFGVWGKSKRIADSDKAATANVPLVQLEENIVGCEMTKINGPWIGQLLFTIFTLAQGIGVIVIWARRMASNDADCLGFDHRMGLMGIASTIISIMSLLIFLQRSTWIIDSPLVSSFDLDQSRERTRLCVRALLALLLETLIETPARQRDLSDQFRFLRILNFILSWQMALLIVFIYVFRNEIVEKFGLQSVTGKLSGHVRPSSTRRLKVLAWIIFVLGYLAFIITSLVIDIIKCVVETGEHSWNRDGYMWQDPWSDRLLVI